MKRILLLLTLIFSLNVMAQVKPDGPYVPITKNLDSQWVESLFQKGDQKVYKTNELTHIAMPCGGIGAGQVEITGEGKICFTESVYNQMQKPNAGLGGSNGAQYLNPQKPESKVENSFSIVVKEKGSKPVAYKLNGDDFDDIHFIGEYPLAQIEYGKTGKKLPVKIVSEVFSPFIPLDLRSSANPVTVVKYSVSNTSKAAVDVSLVAWLKNIAFADESKVNQVNTINKSEGITGISFEMQPLESGDSITKHTQFGGFSLSVLDEKADFSLASKNDEEYIESLINGNNKRDSRKIFTSNEPTGGSLSTGFKLAPNQTKELTFLISWYFPNLNGNAYDTPGWVGHIYNNWYSNSFDVARYVASDFDRLYKETNLFRETYNSTTLPYWLSNRITMPVSTLAAGNISIWQNGRMYAYEGVGFCSGTCGHVYNFVTAISKLFPQLERSVRLQQDLKEGVGFNRTGRINFRGHDAANPKAQHSYASDAQSGYVLKLYREHLMSPDNSFLDSVWTKVKQVIGYHIYMDGAEVGMMPNGVLEGLQTFWDPMWYGPNPYNNTLYLAALRAAEEMARIKNEYKLADRYHALFEKGCAYMNNKMWNGEYYVHLYPSGFKRHGMDNGFAKLSEKEVDALGYIKAFNNGEPSYFVSGACDANQLFGQNWAHQLGLGYILPQEKCLTAAKNIFKYNWTPDISTVYDAWKPKHRILAAPGEGAMINGSWPKEKPRDFENTHDKNDVWSALEYEACCDMINEGLLEEAFIAIRSIHDRYDGVKRNPWNEIEGSDHYSRAMHSWNILLALSGFTFDGPAGKLGFAPKLNPENFKSFFSAAEGWGTIEQLRSDKTQNNIIVVDYGKLVLQTIDLKLKEGLNATDLSMSYRNYSNPESSFTQSGNKIKITFLEKIILNKGEKLEIEIQ